MADLLEVDSQLYPIGSTPLHLAANNNDTKMLTQLIHSYFDINAYIDLTDSNGRSPLVIALQNGHLEAAAILIQAGASLRAQFSSDRTVIDVLHTKHCFLPLVSRLVELASVERLTPEVLAPLLTSLAFECTESDLVKMETILTAFPALVNTKDHLGCSPIHYAAVKGHLDTVKLLLRFSADLTVRNPYGSTPLHIACDKGHLVVAQTILGQGDPEVLLSLQDQLYRTPVHVAMYSLQLPVIQSLIDKFKSSMNLTLRDVQGHTLSTLLFTLRLSKDVEFTQTLAIPCLSVQEATWVLHTCVWYCSIEGTISSLTQGALVNSFDFMQQTPLVLATKIGEVEICKILVEGGANPNVYDEALMTPLHYAFKLNQNDVSKYLLSLDTIDLSLLYQTYDDPLTSEQIECLIHYYRNSSSPQHPQSWLDWLVLASSNPAVSLQTFMAFIEEICPSDWLQQLADQPTDEPTDEPLSQQLICRSSNEKKGDKVIIEQSLQDEVSSYPVLSQLIVKSSNLPVLTRTHSCRGYPLRPMREIMREQKPTTNPSRKPPFVFSKFRQIKIRKFTHKIQYTGPRSTLTCYQFYSRRALFLLGGVPHCTKLAAFLHSLLMHKNLIAFTSVLTRAFNTIPKCLDLILPSNQEDKSTSHLLLNMIGKHFEVLESTFESLGIIDAVKIRLRKKDPPNTSMECALLSYLLSGLYSYCYERTKEHFYNRALRIRIERFPPDWSSWYIELHCNWFLQSLGWKGYATYSTNEEKEKVATFLLQNCNKSNDEQSTIDPSLLIEAIWSDCFWGVQLLLRNGVSPAAPSKEGRGVYKCTYDIRERYPLVEAISHCNIPIVNALLDAWSHDSHKAHMTTDQFSAIFAILPTLATREEPATISRVLTTLNLQESKELWFSRHGARLLYVLLLSTSDECVKLGISLTESVMCLVCHTMLCGKGIESSKFHHLRTRLCPIQRLQKQFLNNCVKFLVFCSKTDHLMANVNTFFCACRDGMHDLVSFILDHVNPEDLDTIDRDIALCNAGHSGDYSMIKLLSDHGFKHSFQFEPPLYGYINYLVQAKHSFPYCVSLYQSSGCALHSRTDIENQEAIIDILIPNSEYLYEMLQSHKHKFPFSQLALILNLPIIAERLLPAIFSAFKSSKLLSNQISWTDIACSFSTQIWKLSSWELVPLLDNFLVDVLPETLDDDGVALFSSARAELWGYCFKVLKSCKKIDFTISTHFKFVKLVSKRGKLDILKLIYSMATSGWIQENTLHLLKIALQNEQTDNALFLLSRVESTQLEEAVIMVAKFGNEACLDAALLTVLANEAKQPGVAEHYLITMLNSAALCNRPNSLLHKIVSELQLGNTEVDMRFHMCMSVCEAATKHGHAELALYALDSSPENHFGNMNVHSSFHNILYWSCYWGLIQVLERLPFTSDQLLHRQESHDLTPWECALANGHVGRVSHLSNAPTLTQAWEVSLSDDNPMGFKPEHLFIGSFDSLMIINQSRGTESDSTDFLYYESPFHTIPHKTITREQNTHEHFIKSLSRVNPQTCIALFKCVGKYAGELFCHSISTSLGPVKITSEEVFEAFLDAMMKTNHLQEYFRKVGEHDSSCFVNIVREGSIRKVRALLDRGVDILKYDHICFSKPSGSLLHAAVQTKNPEIVELILKVYGDKATEACTRENCEKETPLYLAFALGATEVLNKTSLTKIANLKDTTKNDWIKESTYARGWFHLMMSNNERLKDSAQPFYVMNNFSFNIRKVAIDKLLVNATEYGNIPIAISMIKATGNIVMVPFESLALLVCTLKGEPGEFEAGSLATDTLWQSDLSLFLEKINRKFCNNEQVLSLITQRGFTSIQEALSVFLASCYQNRYLVVCKMLEARSTDKIINSALSSKGTLEEGLLIAIASSNMNTAVHLIQETGLTFESIYSETHPFANQIPQLSKLIFTSISYYGLLEKFYKSLCESRDQLSLAGSWLAHNWTQAESQLIVKQLGNTSYAPSNPWLLKMRGRDKTQRDVLVTIDWDSFSESFLSSPTPEVSAKHRYTPLLVEAVVFSPAILGQVCGYTGSTRAFEYLPLLSYVDDLSTLIVTVGVWPATPCFKLYGDQGTLTLSYVPSNGAIIFPTDYKSKADTTQDSGVLSSFESSGLSVGLSDDMSDLCYYFNKQLKKVIWKGASVCVQCDSNLTITDHASAAIQALNDCVDALRLVQIPRVLYAHVNYKSFGQLISTGRKSPFLTRLEVCLNCPDRYSYGQSSFVSAERLGKTLRVIITISKEMSARMNDSLEQETECPLQSDSLYESLVQELTKCLLESEREASISHVKDTLSKSILTDLNHSLKMGRLDEDFVTLGIQDNEGKVHYVQDLDQFTLLDIKNFVKMATFVRTFSKALQILSFKPRLSRTLFSSGLKVILTNERKTNFSIKAGHSLLTISAADLQERTRNENLISVFKSLTVAASQSLRRSSSIEFPRSIPAPFRCYVDLDKSPGFMFPSVKKCGLIIVQLVDHNGTPLTSPPTNQCVLNVTIRDKESKVLSASSSTDPHFGMAFKDLLVISKPEGFFEIRWTPQCRGLHDISIRLNNTPIQSSPLRAYCSPSNLKLGYRQVLAGQQLVFVTSHLGQRCFKNVIFSSFQLPDRTPFLPVCLEAVKPLVDASKRNSQIEPGTGTVRKMPPQQVKTDQHMHPTTDSDSGSHFLSTASKHIRHSKWLQNAIKNVIIFASPELKMSNEKIRNILDFNCVELSNGRSLIKLRCTKACVLKVFAACAVCHSTLTMHWIDHVASEPTHCYITPGPINSHTSKTTHQYLPHQIMTKCKSTHILQIVAGQTLELEITAHDIHKNRHTSGGAIKEAILKPAHCTITSGQHYPDTHRQLVPTTEDIACQVRDHGNGCYSISTMVCVQAKYTLYVNGKVWMESIEVTCGELYAANIQLLRDNSFEVSQSERGECKVALYDRFFNPCPAKKWLNCFIGYVADGQNVHPLSLMSQPLNVVVFVFKPHQEGQIELKIYFGGSLLSFCPIKYTALKEALKARILTLHKQIEIMFGSQKTPTFTVDRGNLLESTMNVLAIHPHYFSMHWRVRFGAEPGIDTGGVARELFHLLSQQLVNPQYALFQNINGFYKPSQSSSVNPNHLMFFEFFGKIIGRAICDGHQLPVRLTPSVCKALLHQQCSLDDLKLEDPTLHMSLLTILNTDSEEALQELAVNFAAQSSHFGAVHTIELEEGGYHTDVTLVNRERFVRRLCNWQMEECIENQLKAMRQGLNHVLPSDLLSSFSSHELEVILNGQPEIDVSFIRSRATYNGYSPTDTVVKWLWDILEGFTQEERCQFLQFTTGSSCLPSADMDQWSFNIQRSNSDPRLLPHAATCFNSISLPVYRSKKDFKEKLKVAIMYGQQTFLLH